MLGASCREEQEGQEGEGQMEAELSKLADDLVQKFEDQWKATAENLDTASKAFDNLEGGSTATLAVLFIKHFVRLALLLHHLILSTSPALVAWRTSSSCRLQGFRYHDAQLTCQGDSAPLLDDANAGTKPVLGFFCKLCFVSASGLLLGLSLGRRFSSKLVRCWHADLLDGKQGFDSSTSVWQQTGWAEVDNLRKKLENLKELRDLVRQLGRAGGKGPLRMAPQEVSHKALTIERS